MGVEALSVEAIRDGLSKLEGWRLDGDGIVQTFAFKDFKRAFGFMTECAFHAEKLNHHPEWSNVYGKVVVRLSTHSVKGISQLDFELAALMNAVFDERKSA